MVYKADPGYVLVKVCDTHLLVAKREKWEANPVVRPIPAKYALCWALMEKGKTSREALQSIGEIIKKPQEFLEEKFSAVFEKLAENGYLIPAEEHDE